MRNILLLCIVALFMSGCGANYHLKRAKKHIEKAQQKDSTAVLSDTTYVLDSTVIETPPINIDTLVDQDDPEDTTKVVIDGVTVKTVYNSKDKKQYISVQKPAQKDTVAYQKPVVTNTGIITKKVKSNKMPIWGYIALGFLGLISIGSLFARR